MCICWRDILEPFLMHHSSATIPNQSKASVRQCLKHWMWRDKNVYIYKYPAKLLISLYIITSFLLSLETSRVILSSAIVAIVSTCYTVRSIYGDWVTWAATKMEKKKKRNINKAPSHLKAVKSTLRATLLSSCKVWSWGVYPWLVTLCTQICLVFWFNWAFKFPFIALSLFSV